MREGEKIKRMKEEYNSQSAVTTDERLPMYLAINQLDEPERIILYLYADFKSQRLLAEYLGVSKLSVRKEIQKIRRKINNYIHGIDNDMEPDVDSRDNGDCIGLDGPYALNQEDDMENSLQG